MNGVDILVASIVVLLVVVVIGLRFILPKFLSRKLKNKRKGEENNCVNCKRH